MASKSAGKNGIKKSFGKTLLAQYAGMLTSEGAFAIVARGLLIIEDLIGVPQIVKSTSLIFSREKPQNLPPSPPITPHVPSS